MTGFTTKYLGLTLRSPLVASAGPMTGDPEMWGRIEQAGAGASVFDVKNLCRKAGRTAAMVGAVVT
jgi:dihydroorotate dehydrogenase